jgi:small subunit ribosomal protein S17
MEQKISRPVREKTSQTSGSANAGFSNGARPQSFVGVVVKTAMKDTATVRVDRFEKHPKYKKYRVRSKKYLVHNSGNTAQVGDTVTIVATRPLSKLKHFAIAHTSAAAFVSPGSRPTN